ncbi:MAG: hypothetical protein IPF54_02630 [Draconibacterium sp.]|nr:hypothetical protein [Draconibacterium sp.]
MKGTTQIKIQGMLDKKWKNSFEGMEISYEGENTVFSGNIKDEAHLHGILNLIRDLNLKLISINPAEKKNDKNTFNN